MNLEITFKNIEVPIELKDKTLREVYTIVAKKHREVVAKIKVLTGDTMYTEEVEKQLTKKEITWLRLGKLFKDLADGKSELVEVTAK